MISIFFAPAGANSARLFRQSERRTRGAFLYVQRHGAADAAGFLTCHCEAPQEPWQSRRTGWNTGRPRRIRKCLLEIATSGLRPPRNDTGGERSGLCHCAPPDAAGFLTCHCEAPQEPWQSRRTGWNTGRPRRIRKCLLEIATSGLRPPRNDTGGERSRLCHCAPPDAAGLLTCHCEAPQEPWQSREGTAVLHPPL